MSYESDLPKQETCSYRVIKPLDNLKLSLVTTLDKLDGPTLIENDEKRKVSFEPAAPDYENTELTNEENLAGLELAAPLENEMITSIDTKSQLLNKYQAKCSDSYTTSLVRSRNKNKLKYGRKIVNAELYTIDTKQLRAAFDLI